MKIIVCGAGLVGFGIARQLAREGHDVTVIDRSPELLDRVRETLDVRPILGHGAHPHILEIANAASADIFIAVTASDEVNMIACHVTRTLFNVPKTIARVRDREYLNQWQTRLFHDAAIPIDVIISPENEIGETVMRRLALPGAFDTANFSDGKIQMVGITIEEDCPIIDTPLHQLTDLFPNLKAIVVGIEREGKLSVPEDEDSLLVGDLAYVVTATTDTLRTLKIFGHEERPARRVVIVGGGNIGLQVARTFEQQGGYQTNIVERNIERAKILAEQLNRTVILNGDSFTQSVMTEAGVEDADLVLALTNDDQVNTLTAIIALQMGCDKSLCLTNDNTFQAVIEQYGPDMTINPRAITISSVLEHMRRGRVLRVHAIGDGAAEVIEFQVLDDSQIAGQKLRDLSLPEGLHFGAILHGGDIIMPRGDTIIQSGDRLTAFVLNDAIEKVEALFEPES